MQKKFSRFIYNRCNISNTSYNDRLVKLRLKSLEYRRWEFDLFTLYKIINGKYQVFFSQFFSFSHNKYQLRGNNRKKSVCIILTTVSGMGQFFKEQRKLPQDVVLFERVEHFRLKLKRFNLNTINISKI